MLEAEYLKHCTDELEDLFLELETLILEDAARRVAENKYVNTSTAQYQLSRAKALGMHDAEIKKRIAEILGVSESKVSDIISSASYASVEKDNRIFEEAYEKGLIHKFSYDSFGMKKLILSGIANTNGEIRNICKTAAKTARNLLVKELDFAYLSVQSGAFSAQDAVKLAVSRLAKQGITWVDYKSGTHRRVDTAVRMALRTGVNQTACRCQDKNFDDVGGNLVEVTSHMGARPSHAVWQGGIFWRKKPYKNYQNFEEATGYGTGAGLGGWNCRHSFYPFFEGLSSKSFEHYRKSENEEWYQLEQQQRYNERQIREWKRREAVNKAGGVDTTKEARKVREWQQRQKDFLKAHPELKRDYGRETLGKRYSLKGLGANNKFEKHKDGMVIKRGKLTVTDQDTKIKVLKAYEKRLVTLDHERAVVISDRGAVYEIVGTSEHVYPEILGNEVLKNAIVTYNHPINETEYTFSSLDINGYNECKMFILRGVDYKFEYQLSNIGETVVDEAEINWQNAENVMHAKIANECRKRGLNYWRKKR